MKRNYVDFNAPRVNEGPAGGKMLSLGLVLSRFGFNEVGTVYIPTYLVHVKMQSGSTRHSP